MALTSEQIAALQAPLSTSAVKSRAQAGRQLSYIEGWHAIAEANRIFGFDGWDRETTELVQLGEPRLVDGKYRVGYRAKVCVRVFVEPDRCVIRNGCGFGSGIDKDVDQAHESALKEAETDAMKRALMTFGNPFGLALYDKEQRNVGEAHEAARPTAPQERPALRAVASVPAAGAAEHLLELISHARTEAELQKVTNAPANVTLYDRLDQVDQDRIYAACQEKRAGWTTLRAG